MAETMRSRAALSLRAGQLGSHPPGHELEHDPHAQGSSRPRGSSGEPGPSGPGESRLGGSATRRTWAATSRLVSPRRRAEAPVAASSAAAMTTSPWAPAAVPVSMTRHLGVVDVAGGHVGPPRRWRSSPRTRSGPRPDASASSRSVAEATALRYVPRARCRGAHRRRWRPGRRAPRGKGHRRRTRGPRPPGSWARRRCRDVRRRRAGSEAAESVTTTTLMTPAPVRDSRTHAAAARYALSIIACVSPKSNIESWARWAREGGGPRRIWAHVEVPWANAKVAIVIDRCIISTAPPGTEVIASAMVGRTNSRVAPKSTAWMTGRFATRPPSTSTRPPIVTGEKTPGMAALASSASVVSPLGKDDGHHGQRSVATTWTGSGASSRRVNPRSARLINSRRRTSSNR